MFKAVWDGAVLAESGHTVKLGGNHYFPAESLHWQYFTDSLATSSYPWKGQARRLPARSRRQCAPGSPVFVAAPGPSPDRGSRVRLVSSPGIDPGSSMPLTGQATPAR